MSNNPDSQPDQIEPADAAELRLVQITDCHIFDAADKTLRGMNTRDSFSAVSKAAIDDSGHLDLLLATGDLSQDGSAASYRYLAQCIDQFGIATYWIPGNHDEIGAMRDNFTGKWISPARQVLAGAWQIVLLDSTVPGEVYGQVSETQLVFLDDCLGRYPERHALVCLHHQARDTGSEWIDSKGLRQSQQLRDRLLAHPQLKAVLWGHVHQEYHQSIDGVLWMSTPSSCVQFKPGSTQFALDTEAPGYRQISLYADGRIDSSVQRIADFEF